MSKRKVTWINYSSFIHIYEMLKQLERIKNQENELKRALKVECDLTEFKKADNDIKPKAYSVFEHPSCLTS